jgi:hypothetical protein
MSWQDEVRRLDAELASGKISLHQHRKEREELLAAVSGGFGLSSGARSSSAKPASKRPEQWRSAKPEPVEQPPEPPEIPEPQEPPEPELSVSAALLASGRPTTAPSPADERATESMRYPSFEDAATVTLRPIRPGEPLPSLTPQNPGTRPGAAGSIPAAAPSPPRRPSWLLLAVGLFVVLVLILGATWLFAFRGSSAGSAPTSPAPSSGTVAAVPLEDRLPALPGTPDVNNSTVSVTKGGQLGLYPTEAANVFTRNDVGEVVYRGSSLGDDQYFVLAIHAGDTGKAQAVADYMRGAALSSGFTALPDDPSVVTGTRGDRRMNGTWYSSDDVAVVLWVSQPVQVQQQTQLKQHLDQTRSALLRALPAR